MRERKLKIGSVLIFLAWLFGSSLLGALIDRYFSVLTVPYMIFWHISLIVMGYVTYRILRYGKNARLKKREFKKIKKEDEEAIMI